MRRPRGTLALVLLLALPACRSSEDAAATVRRSVQTTIAANSARVSLVSRLGDARLIGEGIAWFTASRTSSSMRLSIATPNLSDIRMESLLVDSTFYDRYTRTPGRGKWFRHPDFFKARVRARVFEPLGKLDVRETVEYLQTVDNAKRGGTEDVRGVRARRYTGTVDLRSAPMGADAIFRFGTETMAYTVWIDGQGRIVRLRLDVDALRLIGSNVSGTLTSTYDIYDHGTGPLVTAPPPDQVSLTT